MTTEVKKEKMDWRLSEIKIATHNDLGLVEHVPQMEIGTNYVCLVIGVEWEHKYKVTLTLIFNPEDDATGDWVKFSICVVGVERMLSVLNDCEIHEESDFAVVIPNMQEQIATAIAEDQTLAHFPYIYLDQDLRTAAELMDDYFEAQKGDAPGDQTESSPWLPHLSTEEKQILKYTATATQEVDAFIDALGGRAAYNEVMSWDGLTKRLGDDERTEKVNDQIQKIVSLVFSLALWEIQEILEEASQYVPKPMFLATTDEYKRYGQWVSLIEKFY